MSEHEQKKQRREAALSELGGFGVQVNNGAGVTTEELEAMAAVFGQRGGPSYADLLAFARDVAACRPGEGDDPTSADQETLDGLGAAAQAMLDGGPYNGSYDGA